MNAIFIFYEISAFYYMYIYAILHNANAQLQLIYTVNKYNEFDLITGKAWRGVESP